MVWDVFCGGIRSEPMFIVKLDSAAYITSVMELYLVPLGISAASSKNGR